MKITKQGKDFKVPNIKKFKCSNCECEFELDFNNKEDTDQYVEELGDFAMYTVKCPNCEKFHYSKEVEYEKHN